MYNFRTDKKIALNQNKRYTLKIISGKYVNNVDLIENLSEI